jgi:hypothetical protein
MCTELFVTVQEHFIAYCKCREAVKLFRFLLSPYSLIGTCNNADRQKCGVAQINVLFGGGVTKFEKPCLNRLMHHLNNEPI